MVQLLFSLLLLSLSLCDQISLSSTPEGASLQAASGSISAYRALVIQENVRMVREHNVQGGASFKMEAYPMFVGLTLEQARARYFPTGIEDAFKSVTVDSGRAYTQKQGKLTSVNNIASVDLSTRFRTMVLNQGACGSCYTFSTTDSINMVNQLYRNGIPALSPQHLADCSLGVGLLGGYSNMGCAGGNIFVSMDYVRLYGVHSLAAYPQSLEAVTNGVNQRCRSLPSPRFRIRQWRYFLDRSITSRLQVLQAGFAINVMVAGGNPFFMYYKSGILPNCGGYVNLDHAVVMVGFYLNTSNNEQSYVILKNSWGVNWGESGKIRVSLASDACAVFSYGTFAVQ